MTRIRVKSFLSYAETVSQWKKSQGSIRVAAAKAVVALKTREDCPAF
jgi:hypothetical protein